MFETLKPIGAPGVRRRLLLSLLMLAAAPLSGKAIADTAPVDAISAIRSSSDALVVAMKTGKTTDFNRRYQTLAPEVDRAFDWPAILAVSVGPGWPSLSPDQRNRLLDAFRRYTIASYVSGFNHYDGQTFTVLPDLRRLATGVVLVQSRIVPASGDPTELDYVMKQTISGRKIVDVLAVGSISRVAVQRSDFRHNLSSGGGDALLARLQRKTANLQVVLWRNDTES